MIAVYVPRPGCDIGVAAGSGIVGRRGVFADRELLIHFEGNIYGAANLGRYVERVRQAAGRMAKDYPTVAKRVVGSNEVIRVGWYDVDSDRVFVEDEDALAHWLGTTWGELPQSELIA